MTALSGSRKQKAPTLPLSLESVSKTESRPVVNTFLPSSCVELPIAVLEVPPSLVTPPKENLLPSAMVRDNGKEADKFEVANIELAAKLAAANQRAEELAIALEGALVETARLKDEADILRNDLATAKATVQNFAVRAKELEAGLQIADAERQKAEKSIEEVVCETNLRDLERQRQQTEFERQSRIELSALRGRMEELVSEVTRLRSERGDLRRKVTRLETSLGKTRDELNQATRVATGAEETLAQTIAELRTELGNVRRTKTFLSKKVARLEKELKQTTLDRTQALRDLKQVRDGEALRLRRIRVKIARVKAELLGKIQTLEKK